MPLYLVGILPFGDVEMDTTDMQALLIAHGSDVVVGQWKQIQDHLGVVSIEKKGYIGKDVVSIRLPTFVL